MLLALLLQVAAPPAASGPSGWDIVGTIAAVLAAIAALVTVLYARRTVLDGREAHAEEMRERQGALVAAIRLQRLVHASRLTDVLIAIARAAHEEAPGLAAGNVQPSLIPSLQAQLRAELAVFFALGGPPLPRSDELGEKAYGNQDDVPYQTAQPTVVRTLAGQSLAELKRLADNDQRLSLTLDERLRLALDQPPAPDAKRARRTDRGPRRRKGNRS